MIRALTNQNKGRSAGASARCTKGGKSLNVDIVFLLFGAFALSMAPIMRSRKQVKIKNIKNKTKKEVEEEEEDFTQ